MPFWYGKISCNDYANYPSALIKANQSKYLQKFFEKNNGAGDNSLDYAQDQEELMKTCFKQLYVHYFRPGTQYNVSIAPLLEVLLNQGIDPNMYMVLFKKTTARTHSCLEWVLRKSYIVSACKGLFISSHIRHKMRKEQRAVVNLLIAHKANPWAENSLTKENSFEYIRRRYTGSWRKQGQKLLDILQKHAAL